MLCAGYIQARAYIHICRKCCRSCAANGCPVSQRKDCSQCDWTACSQLLESQRHPCRKAHCNCYRLLLLLAGTVNRETSGAHGYTVRCAYLDRPRNRPTRFTGSAVIAAPSRAGPYSFGIPIPIDSMGTSTHATHREGRRRSYIHASDWHRSQRRFIASDGNAM